LLVVPALVAAQHDVARQIAAMRRGVRAPVAGLRVGLVALWSILLVWGAATLGYAAVQGALYPALAEALPVLRDMAPMSAALLAFVAGAAVVAIAGYIIGALAFAFRSSRRAA
jgi:hypothetical protein